MSAYIRIESDGTLKGTRAFYPNGEPIGGVCGVKLPAIAEGRDAIAIIECELIGKTSIGGCVHIQTDGTLIGSRVLTPFGQELRARAMTIGAISKAFIPKATIEFFLDDSSNVEDKATAGTALSSKEATFAIEKPSIKPEVFRQLMQFMGSGAVHDGDLVSKTARDELFRCGFVERTEGFNVLTAHGVRHLIITEQLKS